jgi:hypothetical protein
MPHIKITVNIPLTHPCYHMTIIKVLRLCINLTTGVGSCTGDLQTFESNINMYYIDRYDH